MKRFFVFLGIVFLTIGSAVRAQEAYSTVPLQKSSWGDAKTTQAGDYIPEVSLKMRGGYNQDFAENAGRFYGDGLYLDINGKTSCMGCSYSFLMLSADYRTACGAEANYE